MGLYDRLPLPLTERIPTPGGDPGGSGTGGTGGSSGTGSDGGNLFTPQGREVDVAIGGVPFRLATTNELPQSIETIPIKRDQLDTENDPGEQSLTSWWRRSQSSWHSGAGDLYQENSDRTIDSTTFFDSSGVDVFTPGQIKLLKKMVPWTAPPVASRIRTYAANSIRTNLSTNPSFETDTTGWAVNNGGHGGDEPTITRDTSKAKFGSASGRLDWGTDDAAGFPPGLEVAIGTLTPDAEYTISLWVWIPTGSPDVVLVGNGVVGTETTGQRDQWVQIRVSSAADGAGDVESFIWPKTPVSAGKKFYVDCMLAEYGNTVGAYFDGGFANCAWDGTPNNSTSKETISSSEAAVSIISEGDLYTAAAIGDSFTLLQDESDALVDALVSGATFYSIDDTSSLYEGAVSSPSTATNWPLGAVATRLGWGKHRLWIIGGRSLWQPDLSLADGVSQSPVFTHPNLGWTYTSMAEGASAMLFGGHDGNTSVIQSLTLDSAGGVPTLTGAAITAAMPDGELVQELGVLAGTYVGIGTSHGFRMGTLDNTGQITYGPLIVSPDGVISCESITTQGRFFLVSFRTATGMTFAYRIDTGSPLDGGIFPYAKDIEFDFPGAISSMTPVNSQRLACITLDGSVWYQSMSEYVSTGFLQTGRIRFRTSEPKVFKALSVEIEPLQGTVAAALIKEGGSTIALGSITTQGEVFSDAFTISAGSMRYASVKLTLAPSVDGLETPVVNSYQLRALPAVAPQRLIILPLLCYDREQGTSGQWYGGAHYARERLTSLHLIEDKAGTVLYQDFTGPNSLGFMVTIESLRFIQTAPPGRYQNTSTGAGGILVVQLRTVI